MKKLPFFLLILLAIVSCKSKSDKIVTYSPLELKENDSVTINYHPNCVNAQLVNVNQIVWIGQLFFEDRDTVLIYPMEKNSAGWQVELKIPQNAYLLSFKFEDELNRADDNNSLGWNLPIMKSDGTIQPNTHYQLGQINNIRYSVLPDFKKAVDEYDKELKLHPNNYKAWLAKWDTENQFLIEKRPGIITQLDSLIKINNDRENILYLAFQAAEKVLQQNEKAISFGDDLIKEFPQSKFADEIAYSLIFIKNPENYEEQRIELEKFIEDYPTSQYLETAYYFLGNYYLNLRSEDNAISIFEKLQKIVPDNLEYNLTLATMKINQKNYTEAKQLLANAKSYCTVEQLRKKNPWLKPNNRINQLNYDYCQIYSLIANLNFIEKNFEESIQNRKTAIELGTPFPAFEWEGIGKAYLELQNESQAKNAFLKALSINPDQDQIIEILKTFYKNETTSEQGFTQYLSKAIQAELKASAEKAPDFEISDLNGNKYKLSEQSGKIIVINFWDSWSKACELEIPELNKLVLDFDNINVVEFWAISIDYKTTIEKFLQQKSFDYQQFYDGSHVKNLYHIIGFPTHLIIDANGLIRYRYVGYTPNIRQKISENINTLIEEGNLIKTTS